MGNNESKFTPQLLECPNESGWKRFICGIYHSIGICNDGETYVWGRNNYGQLGLEHNKDKNIPTLLKSPPDDSEWIQFWCSDHTIGMTKNGNVFVWGWNECGQLGIGHINKVNIPTKLSCPDGSNWKTFAVNY